MIMAECQNWIENKGEARLEYIPGQGITMTLIAKILICSLISFEALDHLSLTLTPCDEYQYFPFTDEKLKQRG